MKKPFLAEKSQECKSGFSMLEDVQAAIPLGFLLSFIIGPVFFVLLETSATKGFRAGLFFDLGVILADSLFILIAYFSSFQLLENLSNLPGLYVFGGVILLVYGITTLKSKKTKEEESNLKITKGGYLGLLAKGFLLNFINVGVLVFWLGVIIVVGPSLNNNPKRILVFFTVMIGTYLMVDIFKILLAKQLRKKLTSTLIYRIKKGLGIILILSGIVLIIKGFLPKNSFTLENGIEMIKK